MDDGSTDNTPALIDNIAGISVLRHPVNQGKGVALLSGFAAAYRRGFDGVVTIDGDGQHLPEDIEILIATAADHFPCIVVGKRHGMDGCENVPWTSRFGRKFSNFWVWVSGGDLLSDSQSGFRLYPLPEVLNLGVIARRYQFEVEVLVKARQHDIPVKEATVQVVYQPRGERVSHCRPWLDFFRNATTFTRLIFARIFRFFRVKIKR